MTSLNVMKEVTDYRSFNLTIDISTDCFSSTFFFLFCVICPTKYKAVVLAVSRDPLNKIFFPPLGSVMGFHHECPGPVHLPVSGRH